MAFQIAAKWFERKTIDDAITLLWEPHVDPLIRCNIWHVQGRDRDLVVDTGLGIMSLREAAKDVFANHIVAVATHTHYDHSGGLAEFDHRCIHKAEEHEPISYGDFGGLYKDDLSPDIVATIEAQGYPLSECLINAIPYADFNPRSYRAQHVTPTQLLAEGEIIDLGDRHFEVLHLPGHSPGSIGLYEAESEMLFSGDAVYDGPLLDSLPGSDIATYIKSMERLLAMPVRTVHAGHDPSFDGDRLKELARGYISRQDR